MRDPSSERPVWDAERRELRVRGVVVKHFKQPAASQEMILTAFEEEGWPPRVYDPLPSCPDQDAKQRLRSIINNLNRAHKVGLIRFMGGGDGASICWRWLTAEEASEYRASPERL